MLRLFVFVFISCVFFLTKSEKDIVLPACLACLRGGPFLSSGRKEGQKGTAREKRTQGPARVCACAPRQRWRRTWERWRRDLGGCT